MRNDNKILFLEPYLVDLIWGGNSLADKYNFNKNKNIAEAWSISAIKNSSSIVKNGKFNGITLFELWNTHKELFGNIKNDQFPILVKFIDAKEDLSVQVHPDDKYAQKFEGECYGKKECWYILDCVPNTKIIIGQNTKNKEELHDCIRKNNWTEILNEVNIKPGDFFQIDPGTVHAIKGGTIILETQQSSDLTYRLYDYGRKNNGKTRELHIDKALDVINYHQNISKPKNYSNVSEGIVQLISCKEYIVNLINCKSSITINQNFPFLNCTVIAGQGNVNGTDIATGNSFIVPNNFGEITFEGNLKLITSTINI